MNQAWEQKTYNRWMQTFIDFANLLGPAEELPEPSTFQSAGKDRMLLERLVAKVAQEFPVPIESIRDDKPDREREPYQGLAEVGCLPLGDGPPVYWPLLRENLYVLFYSIRETLRLIATRRPIQANVCVQLLIFEPLSRALEVESDGRVRLMHDLYQDVFLEALQRLDARRIRICPICGQLYWAWRRDKGACSDTCMNINNVRKFRSPDKAQQYKESRILGLSRQKKAAKRRA
jgi:hypothetical protein